MMGTLVSSAKGEPCVAIHVLEVNIQLGLKMNCKSPETSGLKNLRMASTYDAPAWLTLSNAFRVKATAKLGSDLIRVRAASAMSLASIFFLVEHGLVEQKRRA